MDIERPRHLEKLVAKRGNGLVKVVTGVRRCGKSYLVLNIFRRHLAEVEGLPESAIVEMSFDRYANRRFRDPEAFYPWAVERLSGGGERVVLLDEVQLLGHFEEVLIDLMAMPGVDIYVTGSNAHLLSRDVVTEFRGRGDEVALRPLSFSEFMSAYSGGAQEGYEEYAAYGGMPATVGMKDEEKTDYLRALFNEIYLNDIVERNHVRNVGDLGAVLDVLSSGIGSLTNPNKLADTFRSHGGGPGADTIRSYIEHLKDAFLVEEAKRYDVKGRRYIGSPFKYYLCDTGLRNARMNFRQAEPSHLMENVVYNELRSRGFGVDVGVVTAYGRDERGGATRSQLEVDFVCNRGSRRYYVQSAYAIPDGEKLAQEQASLVRAGDSFKKVIVVREPVPRHYTEQGVLVLGVTDFLLDKGAMDY